MTDYIALIRKDETSDYGVDFPDFPGCVTAGTTLDEARDMAVEALAFHISGMIEEGYDIPEPSSLEALMNDPHNRDAVAVLVTIPGADKAVRVNVVFRKSALQRIDLAAKARGQNRSAYLTEAGLAHAEE